MPNIPGIPSSETVDLSTVRLINGTEIQIASEILNVAFDQDIKYLSPVALNASGELVTATLGTPAIGVATVPVVTDADDVKTLMVIRAGVLNPEALAWDDSYVTDSDKASAFRGAPAPTNIIVKASV